MKNLIFAFLLVVSAVCRADTLWWRVDETSAVDGMGMKAFWNNYPDTDDSYVGARVKATYSGGSTTLQVAYPDPGGGSPYITDHAYVGYSIDDDWNPITDPSDPLYDWGTGNWATQSPFDRELLKEAVFSIEIGQLTYNSATDTMDWMTLAESEPESRAALGRYIFLGGVSLPADDQWTPTVYHAVPEPGCAALMLLGLAVLMLKRPGKST